MAVRSDDCVLDAPTALAAFCGFGLCHKYILYLYLKVFLPVPAGTRRMIDVCTAAAAPAPPSALLRDLSVHPPF